MKAKSIYSPGTYITCALLVLSPVSQGHCDLDTPKKKAERSEENPRPSKGAKSEKRRDNRAQKELREELEKTRTELERTRASLHEANKELGLKAESISTLEAKLSSVTEQLEKARDDLKKTSSASDTVSKQESQLEAGRKRIEALQAEIKEVEKKAAIAIAAAKDSVKAKQPSKAIASKSDASKKTPAPSKAPVITPISYEHASAVNYPERDRTLKEVTEALKEFPKAKVEITGHADDSKYAQTNEDVSANRAKFLATYFVIHGIPEDRIVVKGLGNTRPVKDQANRRVEISILP